MSISVKISALALVAILSMTTCTSFRRGVVSFFSFDDMKKSKIASSEPLLQSTETVPDVKHAFALKLVASGFENITDVRFLPGETSRMLVLEKSGSAYLFDITTAKKTLLLKVAVETASELGLLGMAFHPDFSSNQLFYLHYNPRSDLSRISEWKWLDGRNSKGDEPVSTKELRTILEVDQPYQNHNGGSLVFGPDKMLYIGLGDGGWRGDPENRAQNLKTLLGKMLRIDVSQPGNSSGRAYIIPKDNPFVGDGRAEPEIFAYGLRNPWKYSFDSRGRLIAADVGQDKWEEVSIVPKGGNMGWRVFEGFHCYTSADSCDELRKKVVPPFAVYDHKVGASITGGFEYRGKKLSSLSGRYVFGDFISGRIWSVEVPEKSVDSSSSATPLRAHGKWDILISTFAEDSDGEMYVADFSRGSIYLITSAQK